MTENMLIKITLLLFLSPFCIIKEIPACGLKTPNAKVYAGHNYISLPSLTIVG
jgi:hypothetical protein